MPTDANQSHDTERAQRIGRNLAKLAGTSTDDLDIQTPFYRRRPNRAPRRIVIKFMSPMYFLVWTILIGLLCAILILVFTGLGAIGGAIVWH